MTDIEDLIRQTLRDHEVDDYEAGEILARVRGEREAAGLRMAKSALPGPTALVALAAAVVILVAIGWWTTADRRSSGTDRDPILTTGTNSPTSTTEDVFIPPPGMQYVGYRTVMFTLPQNFSANSSLCGAEAPRLITYPVDPPKRTSPCLPSPLDAVVAFDDSIVGPPALLGKTIPAGFIGGEQVLVTSTTRRGSYYQQFLAVPAQRFFVRVAAHRRGLVEQIIGSARAVPPGYAVVPPLDNRQQTAAKAAVQSAGLNVGAITNDVLGHGANRVFGQLPGAGAVVPLGSAVDLQIFRPR